MGRAGRAAVTEHLSRLRSEWRLDFVVVNGENASNGMGLSAEHAKAILAAGADCITLGDHAFDQKDMLQFIESEPRIFATAELCQKRTRQRVSTVYCAERAQGSGTAGAGASVHETRL